MNVGYEDKELKSYNEPEQDFSDLKRIGQTLTHTHTHIQLRLHVVTCWTEYGPITTQIAHTSHGNASQQLLVKASQRC